MNKGFSLIKLLLFISFIALLAWLTNFSPMFIGRIRDTKRKYDLKKIAIALEEYKKIHNKYPKSSERGFIHGCYPDSTNLCIPGQVWRDGLTNTFMSSLPQDPRQVKQQYFYWSNSSGDKYQLYAYLEDELEGTVNLNANSEPLYYWKTTCGEALMCNYGISSSNITPEYDRTLITKQGKSSY